jgi:hypothetical protein
VSAGLLILVMRDSGCAESCVLVITWHPLLAWQLTQWD